MSRWDALFGAACVLATALMFGNAAMHAIIQHPNWRGLISAVSTLATGCYIVASVWRDRL